jgi:hypothetical protein
VIRSQLLSFYYLISFQRSFKKVLGKVAKSSKESDTLVGFSYVYSGVSALRLEQVWNKTRHESRLRTKWGLLLLKSELKESKKTSAENMGKIATNLIKAPLKVKFLIAGKESYRKIEIRFLQFSKKTVYNLGLPKCFGTQDVTERQEAKTDCEPNNPRLSYQLYMPY